jgi:Iap family predicted aminopeptidase
MFYFDINETEPCPKSYIAIKRNKQLKFSWLQKNRDSITQNDSFSKNWGPNIFRKLLRILQNVIEKSFINWQVFPLVKINTRPI